MSFTHLFHISPLEEEGTKAPSQRRPSVLNGVIKLVSGKEISKLCVSNIQKKYPNYVYFGNSVKE